jgi:branched-chain amino acid transport system ATP-binding protein
MDLSHRVTVLNFGEKIAEGPPDEIRRDPSVQDAYLGEQHEAVD